MVIIAVALMGGGAYLYTASKNQVEVPETEIQNETETKTVTPSTHTNTTSSNSVLVAKGSFTFEDSSGTQFELQIAQNNKAHLTVTGRQVYRQLNLSYSVKGERLSFYFDSYDNSDDNANRLEISNKLFSKGQEVFTLDTKNSSSYQITWNNPDLWLNNVDVDLNASIFKKK